jgi:uncharacterized delta-60 repeat protein
MDFGQNVLARFTANGTVDSSFGTNGVVVQSTDVFPAAFSALTLLSDGSIVAVGLRSVAHFQANGAPDYGFGNGGEVSISGAASTPQTNGKIVVAGYGGSDTRYSSGFAVWRLSPTGALDPGFGTGGSTITPIGTGAADARAVAILPDGRIIVAGASSATFTGGSDSNFAVARYFGD